MDEEKKTSILDFIFSVILIGGIIGGIYYYGSMWERNRKEIILRDVNTGEITFFESKYFWGGVWFHKDRLSILSDRLIILINSKFFGEETIQLPYQKVKKVIFEEGLSIFKITVESEGRVLNDKYNFYIEDKGNFVVVKDNIRNYGDKMTIIENKTLLNRIFNSEQKKKKRLSQY